jgi:hypothetical protein
MATQNDSYSQLLSGAQKLIVINQTGFSRALSAVSWPQLRDAAFPAFP